MRQRPQVLIEIQLRAESIETKEMENPGALIRQRYGFAPPSVTTKIPNSPFGASTAT